MFILKGLDVWPTCQLVDIATDKAIDLLNKIREDKDDVTYSSPPLAGKSYLKPLRK